MSVPEEAFSMEILLPTGVRVITKIARLVCASNAVYEIATAEEGCASTQKRHLL